MKLYKNSSLFENKNYHEFSFLHLSMQGANIQAKEQAADNKEMP